MPLVQFPIDDLQGQRAHPHGRRRVHDLLGMIADKAVGRDDEPGQLPDLAAHLVRSDPAREFVLMASQDDIGRRAV